MTDYTVLYCSTCAGLLRVLLIDWKYFGERHFVPTLSHLWRGLKGEKRRPNWRKITCNASVVLMKSHHESLLLIGPPPKKKWGSAGPEAMRCGPYFRRIYFLKILFLGWRDLWLKLGSRPHCRVWIWLLDVAGFGTWTNLDRSRWVKSIARRVWETSGSHFSSYLSTIESQPLQVPFPSEIRIDIDRHLFLKRYGKTW